MNIAKVRQLVLSPFKDKRGRIVIFEAPNYQLSGWFVFKILAFAVNGGSIHHGFDMLSTAFLFSWALLELTSGVNLFRRTLGGVVIAVLVFGFFNS